LGKKKKKCRQTKSPLHEVLQSSLTLSSQKTKTISSETTPPRPPNAHKKHDTQPAKSPCDFDAPGNKGRPPALSAHSPPHGNTSRTAPGGIGIGTHPPPLREEVARRTVVAPTPSTVEIPRRLASFLF
ncbi:unnamed protein product, partial [Ectocarpus sp. 12 AP-2014]